MSELAADGIPVAVTCRVLKIARQPYYRWLAQPVTAAELTQAYRGNALVDAHREDPEFGSGHFPWTRRLAGDPSYPNPNVGVVEKPPFYGVKLAPVGVGINSHGLRTDSDARVLHVRGQVIPGLYAVGMSQALLDLGGGYQSGTSNMRAITWGYVAGQHAAKG